MPFAFLWSLGAAGDTLENSSKSPHKEIHQLIRTTQNIYIQNLYALSFFCQPTFLPPFFFQMDFWVHLLLLFNTVNWELNCRLSLLLHTAREKWVRDQTYSPALGKCPELSNFRKLFPKCSFHSHQNSSYLLAIPFFSSQAGTPGRVSYDGPVK